jgi:hypothetical protein
MNEYLLLWDAGYQKVHVLIQPLFAKWIKDQKGDEIGNAVVPDDQIVRAHEEFADLHNHVVDLRTHQLSL